MHLKRSLKDQILIYTLVIIGFQGKKQIIHINFK